MKPSHPRDLIGAWRLVSHESQLTGQPWKSWGKNPRGLLIYTAEGAMSVSLNKDVEGNPFDAILFYAGRFELAAPGKVLHHVEYASDFARVSQTLPRDADLEGDALTLSAEQPPGRVVRVRWKKIR